MVSVIITNYNHRAELPAAVQSILNQTYQDFEIIIINNDPAYSLGSYIDIDERIIYLWSDIDHNKEHALNYGLRVAGGEYIAFQDADDISLPYRLSESLRCIKNYDLVYGDKITLFQNGRQRYDIAKPFTRDTLWNGSIGVNSSIMIRADKSLEFKEMGYDADREWCARLLKKGIKTRHIDLPFYYFSNFTSNYRIRQRGFLFRYYDAVRNKMRLRRLRSKSDKIVREILEGK